MARVPGARAIALQEGRKTFLHDTVCKCGSRLRYTRSSVCVQCQANKRDWQNDAFKAEHAARQRAYRAKMKTHKKGGATAAGETVLESLISQLFVD